MQVVLRILQRLFVFYIFCRKCCSNWRVEQQNAENRALRFKRKGRSSRTLRQIVWHYLQKSPLNFASFAIYRSESSIVNLIYVKRNVFM
ncbi:hypothetical protein CJI54_03625 [Bifidobacteriaceae bacterium NR026]|nr:hypothetical protein CJI54_03625 [Bifidobacteriaceae bacterium NR026]